jgi:hypothetical protein
MYNDEDPTCKATYATLCIYHDDLEPDNVSSRLGVTPSKSQKKGQALGVTRVARVGAWFLKSENHVISKDVRRHVDWILDQLAGNEDQLLKLQGEGYKTLVSCYWLSVGHGGPELDPEIMQRLVSLRLTIFFDVYS